MATINSATSADDAPLGSVILPKTDPLTIRYPDGRGWHLLATPCATTRKGWLWHEHDITGPVQLNASGLTEDECRTLSGMSAADAVLWCERRSAAMLHGNPCAEALRFLGWDGKVEPVAWAKSRTRIVYSDEATLSEFIADDVDEAIAKVGGWIAAQDSPFLADAAAHVAQAIHEIETFKKLT